MLLKKYERDPLFTRATGDGLEAKGSKDDPLACITSYDAVIVTAFVGTGSLLQSGMMVLGANLRLNCASRRSPPWHWFPKAVARIIPAGTAAVFFRNEPSTGDQGVRTG